MTQPTGRRLERLVAAIHHAESSGADVRWNDTIDGRQFDVTIRFRFGIHSYLTVIECKDYSAKVSVEKVDAFVTKTRDAHANKAIIISSRGFQSGCFAVAERHGIQLLVLNESADTPDLVAKMTPGLNVYNVRFSGSDNTEEHELEDWGGRLAYLMNHAQVILPTERKNPNRLVYEWQLTHPQIDLDRENQVDLGLPAGSKLKIPHESPVSVSAMRFCCALIEVAIPKTPIFDNHILAGLSTKIELRDAKGNLQHSSRLRDLELGYDTPVEVGKFYLLPTMFNHYYCEKIENGLITWILVESYQHGHLFQAELTQKMEYSRHYVEVTDERTLQRLRAMLTQLKAHDER
jgi:Restriction endonuclease